VLHSRTLPRVLGKLNKCDGPHVGSERMDCAEWQKIDDQASEWQTLRDEDATRVSWEDVYLDLASTYEHVLTHCTKSHGGDPTGPAGRSARFPVGVGFMGMGVEDFEDGCDKQALGLAAQYESTFGKPATVQDYTKLVEITSLYQAQLILTLSILTRKMDRLMATKRGLLTTLTR